MRARRVLLALFLLVAPAARAQVGADWTAATGGSIRPGYDLNSCGAANSGALRYNTTVNQFQVCYGSGSWVGLADASGTVPAAVDRITSGTAGVFVSNTGVINFRTGGVTTGYFDTAGVLIAPGISITTANGISSTNGYFSGAVVNAPQANAGTSIDWSEGNVQYTSASCGAFTFTNMQDGGVYSLTVKGTTAGTCSFSQSGLTFRLPPNHGMVSTGTMTFYTFTRSGSDVMVNWMPGY